VPERRKLSEMENKEKKRNAFQEVHDRARGAKERARAVREKDLARRKKLEAAEIARRRSDGC